MRIFGIWMPGKYRPVEISAERELELPVAGKAGHSVASFSCGVDSSFTLFRHVNRRAGRRTRQVGAGIVQHGFDVWLGQPNNSAIYSDMLADAQAMLKSLDVPCIPIKTNFQQLPIDWADAWGTQQVGGLYLFAGAYDSALIANDLPYQRIGIPWASHPVTNGLLGSRGFEVIDDGGDYSRAEKAKLISAWPEAMERLHVCFGATSLGTYANCCTCEKCIRTILAFRIAGVARPGSFARDPTDAEIRNVRLEYVTKVKRWEELDRDAEAAGFGGTEWAGAIRSVVRRARWRNFRNGIQKPFIPLRNIVRRVARGTTLSQSEIRQHSMTIHRE